LQFEYRIVDLVDVTKEQFNSSKEKLNKLDDVDKIKHERETALNDLESFVLNVREKLYEDMYEKSSTEDEREKIREKVIYHDFGQIKYYQNCSKYKIN
jgi:hypoxia up-regulated 1